MCGFIGSPLFGTYAGKSKKFTLVTKVINTFGTLVVIGLLEVRNTHISLFHYISPAFQNKVKLISVWAVLHDTKPRSRYIDIVWPVRFFCNGCRASHPGAGGGSDLPCRGDSQRHPDLRVRAPAEHPAHAHRASALTADCC